jgi:sporadic carbohydrate cluster 2OG-Fe(II) oxygenase
MNKNFLKKGYTILNIPTDKLKFFVKERDKVKNFSRKFVKIDKNKKFKLENFHEFNLKGKKNLNDLRMKIMREINKNRNFQKNVYNSLSFFLDNCLGPDVVTQKFVNLVIQKPNDTDRAPFHKDGPVASNYELVLWIPFVDCYKTMNMYLFDNELHDKTKIFLKKNSSIEKLDDFSKKYGKLIDVNFGQILIFWSNVFHYIPINKENSTRWSLNIRYKNLFTKYGTKNMVDYYKILKLSPITKMLQQIDV